MKYPQVIQEDPVGVAPRPSFYFSGFFIHTDVAVSRFFPRKITFFEMAQNLHFLVIFSRTVRPTDLKTLLCHLRTISFHIELGFSYSDQPSLQNRVRSLFQQLIFIDIGLISQFILNLNFSYIGLYDEFFVCWTNLYIIAEYEKFVEKTKILKIRFR